MLKKMNLSFISCFCIIVTILIQFKSIHAEDADIPWQMFRRDLQHTGQSPFVGPKNSEVKWAFKIDTRITSSPAVGCDGVIYFGSVDGRLYALNQDGAEKWVLQVGDEITASPAIGRDGTIYIGSRDKKNVCCFS